jgi:hypothetical protein
MPCEGAHIQDLLNSFLFLWAILAPESGKRYPFGFRFRWQSGNPRIPLWLRHLLPLPEMRLQISFPS